MGMSDSPILVPFTLKSRSPGCGDTNQELVKPHKVDVLLLPRVQVAVLLRLLRLLRFSFRSGGGGDGVGLHGIILAKIKAYSLQVTFEEITISRTPRIAVVRNGPSVF
jgi:hypothetical protein